MTDETVKTGENRKPGAFAKGSGVDPRINRKGRPRVPKTAKELNKLLLEIAAEEVTNPNTGEKVERLRAMLRGMFTGRQSADKVHILDRLYGRIPQSVELTGKDGGAVAVKAYIGFSPDEWDKDDAKEQP